MILRILRKRVDAGAELLLSQLFFDNDTFFNFAEDCRLAGINVPVIPGIMPCINAAQIQRMVTMCGAKFPEKFQKIVHRYGDNKAALFDAGMSYCESQIIELLANDVEGIHLYTMNNVRVAKRLTEGIEKPYLGRLYNSTERKPWVPRAHTYSCRRYAAWLRYCTKLCLMGFYA